MLYNLFTSTDKKLRDEHYENLLKHYHSSLSEAIEAMGSDPKALFTFDDLQNELKRFGKFAFLSSPLLIRIMLADPKDIRNYDDLKPHEEELKRDQKYAALDENADLKYRDRINGVVGDLIRYGYY